MGDGEVVQVVGLKLGVGDAELPRPGQQPVPLHMVAGHGHLAFRARGGRQVRREILAEGARGGVIEMRGEETAHTPRHGQETLLAGGFGPFQHGLQQVHVRIGAARQGRRDAFGEAAMRIGQGAVHEIQGLMRQGQRFRRA